MRTEDLIAQLSAATPPVRAHARARRLAVSIGLGGLASAALMLVLFGVRPDIAAAGETLGFWLKWVFTIGVFGAAFAVVMRLGQPGARVRWIWLGLAAPFAVFALLAGMELSSADPAVRAAMIFGSTAPRCSASIALLGAPVFAGLVWAFRRLAPTRQRLAGAAAGVLAAAAGATIYALSCQEETAAFLITWYTLGMSLSAGLGALLGPRLMRW